jgi:hypothetical protein
MCFLHKWSKWQTTESGGTYRRKFDVTGFVKYPVGRYVIQTRECTKCGRKEIREEST